jgi:hypothetical protein
MRLSFSHVNWSFGFPLICKLPNCNLLITFHLPYWFVGSSFVLWISILCWSWVHKKFSQSVNEFSVWFMVFCSCICIILRSNISESFFFFCGTGVWTQGLMLVGRCSTTWAVHSVLHLFLNGLHVMFSIPSFPFLKVIKIFFNFASRDS